MDLIEVDMFGVETRKRSIAGGRQIGAVCDIRNARQNATLVASTMRSRIGARAKTCPSRVCPPLATPIQPVNIGIVDQCQAKIEAWAMRSVAVPTSMLTKRQHQAQVGRPQRPDLAVVTIDQIFVLACLLAHL